MPTAATGAEPCFRFQSLFERAFEKSRLIVIGHVTHFTGRKARLIQHYTAEGCDGARPVDAPCRLPAHRLRQFGNAGLFGLLGGSHWLGDLIGSAFLGLDARRAGHKRIKCAGTLAEVCPVTVDTHVVFGIFPPKQAANQFPEAHTRHIDLCL